MKINPEKTVTALAFMVATLVPVLALAVIIYDFYAGARSAIAYGADVATAIFFSASTSGVLAYIHYRSGRKNPVAFMIAALDSILDGAWVMPQMTTPTRIVYWGVVWLITASISAFGDIIIIDMIVSGDLRAFIKSLMRSAYEHPNIPQPGLWREHGTGMSDRSVR